MINTGKAGETYSGAYSQSIPRSQRPIEKPSRGHKPAKLPFLDQSGAQNNRPGNAPNWDTRPTCLSPPLSANPAASAHSRPAVRPDLIAGFPGRAREPRRNGG